jgi:hypothetical protein
MRLCLRYKDGRISFDNRCTSNISLSCIWPHRCCIMLRSVGIDNLAEVTQALTLSSLIGRDANSFLSSNAGMYVDASMDIWSLEGALLWALARVLNAGGTGGDKVAILTGVLAVALPAHSDVSEKFLEGVCRMG